MSDLHQHMPTLGARSFRCPFCKAIAHQTWFQVRAAGFPKDQGPVTWSKAEVEEFIEPATDLSEEGKAGFRKLASAEIFINENTPDPSTRKVENLSISRCFSCDNISVWQYASLIWPRINSEVEPNPDLPADIRTDFVEAAEIVERSPRGAAALLRLAIQKLCKELGESGENINTDIAALVKKGLAVKVQRALDIVRVVGNEAVHPGSIDLRDDRETAMQLFSIVNIIADMMISQPKHIDSLYASLPETKLEGIRKRDNPSAE